MQHGAGQANDPASRLETKKLDALLLLCRDAQSSSDRPECGRRRKCSRVCSRVKAARADSGQAQVSLFSAAAAATAATAAALERMVIFQSLLSISGANTKRLQAGLGAMPVGQAAAHLIRVGTDKLSVKAEEGSNKLPIHVVEYACVTN